MLLNVFGENIKVVYKDLSGTNLDGYFSPQEKKIYIHNSLSKQDNELVIVHELGHAILYRVGIVYTSVNKDVVEVIVEAMAKGILENFKLTKK